MSTAFFLLDDSTLPLLIDSLKVFREKNINTFKLPGLGSGKHEFLCSLVTNLSLYFSKPDSNSEGNPLDLGYFYLSFKSFSSFFDT
jgi:hypothetical protein